MSNVGMCRAFAMTRLTVYSSLSTMVVGYVIRTNFHFLSPLFLHAIAIWSIQHIKNLYHVHISKFWVVVLLLSTGLRHNHIMKAALSGKLFPWPYFFYPEYFIALPVLLFLRFCYKARKAEASFFLFFFENTFASFFLSNCWIVIFWTAIRVIRLECWYLWFFFCRDCLSKLFNSLLYLSCLHFSLVLTRKSWRNEYSWSWNR